MSSSSDTEDRRPGEWPALRILDADEPGQAAEHLKATADEARRHFLVSRISGYLAEEPTPADITEAVHRWCTDIEQAAEEIIRGRK